jgi:GH43 family beta-xylosidase
VRLAPAWPGYFADPFVLRHDGVYWAYGTSGPDEPVSDTHFAILRSTDLARWTFAGRALSEPPELRAAAFWAPEVAYRDGTFHLFYSAGGAEGEDHRIRVAQATAPTGPFADAGVLGPERVEVVPGEPFSIDPSPFRDPRTGRWYLFFVKDFFDARVGSGIAVAELADDMRATVGAPCPILRATADWQIFARDREWYGRRWDAWHTVEGPFVVYRRERYWLFYSGGLWKGANYGVGVAVADDVLGPYREPARPESGASLLRSTDELRGPGHNCVVTAPDGTTDVIVFHAWDAAFTARRMFTASLVWNDAGPALGPPIQSGGSG